MFEYVLGIGNLTEDQCKEVLADVSKRATNMKKALVFLQNEYNHLELIKFQTTQRLSQIETEKIK